MDDRTVLVTGGGSGIGEATCLALGRKGYRVAVVDHDGESGTTTAEELMSRGTTAIFVEADITLEGDVESMVEETLAAFGRLDAAVNNAGIVGLPESRSLHEYPKETWDAVLGVNLTGTWLCMKQELAHMLEAGQGSIVNVASTVGLTGSVGRVAYSTSKHGVIGLTRSAAKEYGSTGLRINAVCPGATLTSLLQGVFDENPALEQHYAAQVPASRLADPTEVAAAIVWLCESESSYVNGVALPVDGGATA